MHEACIVDNFFVYVWCNKLNSPKARKFCGNMFYFFVCVFLITVDYNYCS